MSKQKPQLLFIPGLACTADLWAHQIATLKDEFDIIIADHSQATTMVELTSNILEGIEGNFALCGLSMGGYVALDIMRKAPDRVVKLCLMATQARLDTEEQRKRRIDFMKLAKMGKFKGLSPMLIRNFIHPDRLEDKSITNIIYKMAKDTGFEGFINQSTIILDRIDSRPHLKDIKCPTMVLVGCDDERVPMYLSKEMVDLIPNSDLISVANCGHLPPLEKPQQTSEHLFDFLIM